MKQKGLTHKQHAEIARKIFEAEKNVTTVPLLTETYDAITQEDAYAIQQEGLKLRLEAGEHIVGRKIGLTSRRMMEQLHVDAPDYAYLTASTRVLEGGACKCSEMRIAP